MASAWHGLSLAFAGAPLDASPVWTRLDNYAGVTIQRISTTRGRPSEDQKTSTGQVSVYGTDRAGVMDPTNATGPFWSSGATQLDPVKQAAIAIYDPTTSDWWPRFRGYLDKLTYTIYPSGKFATFQLDLVDALDILTDAEVLPGHAGATPPGASVGNAWYATQAVDDRIYAAVVDASTSVLGTMIWPAGLLDVFTGNVDVQDTVYSARTPLLQVVQDACDAEFPFAPNLYVSITGQLSFRGRYARFNPADASYDIGHWYVGDHPAHLADARVVELGMGAGGELPFTFTRGKLNLINAAYVAPFGIAASDKAGQLVYDSGSITKYAVRSVSIEDLQTRNGHETPPLLANAETKLMAQYLVDNYKVPQNRPQSIVVRSYPTGDPRATQNWRFLRNVELGDWITLTTTHPGGGGFAGVDFFVEQIREDIIPRNGQLRGEDITMTLEISPRAYYDTNPFSGDHPGGPH